MLGEETSIMVQLALVARASYLEDSTYGEIALEMLGELHKRGYEITKKRPTVHELEAILDDPDLTIEINPDGSSNTRPHGDDYV